MLDIVTWNIPLSTRRSRSQYPNCYVTTPHFLGTQSSHLSTTTLIWQKRKRSILRIRVDYALFSGHIMKDTAPDTPVHCMRLSGLTLSV